LFGLLASDAVEFYDRASLAFAKLQRDRIASTTGAEKEVSTELLAIEGMAPL